MTKKYVIQLRDEKYPRIVDVRRVTYRPLTKVDHQIDMGALGKVNVVKETGKVDKNRLEIWTDAAPLLHVEPNRESVHSKIRVIREQEAQAIDLLDLEIASLRDERTKLIKRAWQKGEPVMVQDLKDMAEGTHG